jgi:hypothetical protein
MNKPIPIIAAIFGAIAVGAVCAHDTIKQNDIAYQSHPTVAILTDFFGAFLSVFFFYFVFAWFAGRKQKKLKQFQNDKFYEQVARELQEKELVAGLWTKAYAEMDGDDAKARAQYIKYRVEQLAEASRQQFENDRLAKKRQEEEKNAAVEAEKRKTRTRLHRFCHGILLIIFLLLTIVFGLGGLGAIIAPFTEDTNSSDLIGEIIGGVFLFLLAFACGIGVKHCSKEIQ